MFQERDSVHVTITRSVSNCLIVYAPDTKVALLAAWDYYRLGISGTWKVTHVDYRRDGSPAEWILEAMS